MVKALQFQQNQFRKMSQPILLFRIPTDISCVVTTEDGQKLNVIQEYNRNNEQISHGQGNLIVCGAKQLDNGDFVSDTEWGFWVVNGAVAENTYESLGKEYALEDVGIGEVGNDILEGDSVSINQKKIHQVKQGKILI